MIMSAVGVLIFCTSALISLMVDSTFGSIFCIPSWNPSTVNPPSSIITLDGLLILRTLRILLVTPDAILLTVVHKLLAMLFIPLINPDITFEPMV